MLVAELDGKRELAKGAERGRDYVCPLCKDTVIPHLGRKVIHHFAHKPGAICDWASGETNEHLIAKQIVYEALTARGVKAQLEYVVRSMVGDRRVDVMAWSARGTRIAIELQHTSIGVEEIEQRALCYAKQRIAQLWIPFLRESAMRDSSSNHTRYSPLIFERWVHGLHGKDGMWMFESDMGMFKHARLSSYKLWKEVNEYTGGGGYHYRSKKYRTLSLSPGDLFTQLQIIWSHRRAFKTKLYHWPEGLVATLQVPKTR